MSISMSIQDLPGKKFIPLERFDVVCPKCGSHDVEIDTFMYNAYGTQKSHSPDSSIYYIQCRDCDYEYKPGYGHYVEEL